MLRSSGGMRSGEIRAYPRPRKLSRSSHRRRGCMPGSSKGSPTASAFRLLYAVAPPEQGGVNNNLSSVTPAPYTWGEPQLPMGRVGWWTRLGGVELDCGWEGRQEGSLMWRTPPPSHSAELRSTRCSLLQANPPEAGLPLGVVPKQASLQGESGEVSRSTVALTWMSAAFRRSPRW